MLKTTKIYANTVASFNAGKLLDSEKIKRVADAEYSDAVKMLLDYGWGGGIMTDSSFDVDALINSETEELISFIEEYCPDDDVAELLKARYLYNNAKVAYKSKFVKTDFSTATYDITENVTDNVLSGDYSSLPSKMGEALTKLDAIALDGTVSAKDIDVFLTRAMFEDVLDKAKKSKNKIIYKYFIATVDLNNISALMRSRKLNFTYPQCAEMIIDGGTLSFDDLMDTLSLDNGKFVEAFAFTPYYDIVLKAAENEDIVTFETESDDYLYLFTVGNALDMLSMTPFLNYVVTKSLELKIVKMILVCLKNGVKDEIKKRMRCIYD